MTVALSRSLSVHAIMKVGWGAKKADGKYQMARNVRAYSNSREMVMRLRMSHCR